METVFAIDDLVDKILSSDVIDIPTYRNIRLTCHKWNILAGTDRIDKYSNHLATLIQKYPHIGWKDCAIIRNNQLPLNIIIKYNHMCSSCRKIHGILYNNNITWESILELGYDDYEIIYQNYADKPYVTWEIIMQYPNANWNWEQISRNPNITMDIIINNPQYDWSYWHVSANPNLTWDFIQSRLDMTWNWWEISQHKCVTWDILLLNFNLPWMESIALNTNITWDIIITNLDKFQLNYNWDILSQHPHINPDDVLKYRNKIWWSNISKNPSIKWDFIVAYSSFEETKLPWDWAGVSENPNITIKIIKANPQYPWNWNYVSRNPGLTWRELVNNEDIFVKLNLHELVINPF